MTVVGHILFLHIFFNKRAEFFVKSACLCFICGADRWHVNERQQHLKLA